jgi:hypothetical protein
MKRFSLRRLLWNAKALGAPVGNLIILIAAVALSTTVVLYAVNVTTNQVQKESLYISSATLTTDQADIGLTNTGPTSIRITQLIIKGDRYTNYTTNPDIGTGLAKGNSTTLTLTITNGAITVDDVGRPITIVIATTQCSYFIETLVQASAETPP